MFKFFANPRWTPKHTRFAWVASGAVGSAAILNITDFTALGAILAFLWICAVCVVWIGVTFRGDRPEPKFSALLHSFRQPLKHFPTQEEFRVHRQKQWKGTCSVLVMLPFLAIWEFLTGFGMGSQSWFMLFFIPMMILIFILIQLGTPVRIGNERRCAACDYQMPFENSGPVCSECGADWHKPTGRVNGKLHSRPWLVVAGIALLPLLPLLFAGTGFIKAAVINLRTKSSLIQEITKPHSGFNTEPWVELRKRSLTRREERSLIQGLLDKRLEDGYLHMDDEAFMDAALAAGMPIDLESRYFEEMHRFRMNGPDRVNVGEKFSIGISGCTDKSTSLAHPALFFQGYWISDLAGPYFERNQSLSIYDLMAEKDYRCDDFLTHKAIPFSLKRDFPTTIQIHAVIWIVMKPGHWPLNVDWEQDFAPPIPQDSIWEKKIELVKTIEVVANE